MDEKTKTVKLKINTETNEVIGVEGGNIEKREGSFTTVEVAQTSNLSPGCPAWIKIGGTWYKI